MRGGWERSERRRRSDGVREEEGDEGEGVRKRVIGRRRRRRRE